MKKSLKVLLVISLTLNFLILSSGVFLIYEKGGVVYLQQKIEASTNALNDENPSYSIKQSVFSYLPKTEKSIVFLGDSLTEGNEWSEWLGSESFLNRGISGDSSDGVLNRMNAIVDMKPKSIFIMIGVNDIYKKIPVEDTIENYNQILSLIKKYSPETNVYVQSVLPVNESISIFNVKNSDIISLNNEIRLLAENHNYNYLDLHSIYYSEVGLDEKYTYDGLHLTGEGYKVWVEYIKKYIEE